MGLVVGQNHHGRWLLQDRRGRFRAQVAAHVALPKHRLPLYRQCDGTEQGQAGAAGEDCSRPGSMPLQHRL